MSVMNIPSVQQQRTSVRMPTAAASCSALVSLLARSRWPALMAVSGATLLITDTKLPSYGHESARAGMAERMVYPCLWSSSSSST